MNVIDNYQQQNMNDVDENMPCESLLKQDDPIDNTTPQSDNYYDKIIERILIYYDTNINEREEFQNNMESPLLSKNENPNESIIKNCLNKHIKTKLKQRQSEYKIQLENIHLFIGTWNVAGQQFKNENEERISLSKWIFGDNTAIQYDLLVIGFQEIVELNVTNIINDNKTKQQHDYWIDCILNVLNDGDTKYKCLLSKDLVGLLLCTFVKINDHVKQIKHNIIHLGCYGIAGNKGSISMRFQYYDTTFCFTNLHLAAREENLDARNVSLKYVIDNSYFILDDDDDHDDDSSDERDDIYDQKIVHLNDHDYSFLLGDLNYRLSDYVSNTTEDSFESVIQSLQTNNEPSNNQELIEKLLKYDQYSAQKQPSYIEGKLKEILLKLHIRHLLVKF